MNAYSARSDGRLFIQFRSLIYISAIRNLTRLSITLQRPAATVNKEQKAAIEQLLETLYNQINSKGSDRQR